MDASNAPNPTNPATQDQFVDAVQGPAAQAQGPAAQAPAVEGPTAQGPAKNNAPVGQNVPVQPPHQLAPAQPIPAGPVVPPSSILSKLDRKET